jgi:hypothetical protein
VRGREWSLSAMLVAIPHPEFRGVGKTMPFCPQGGQFTGRGILKKCVFQNVDYVTFLPPSPYSWFPAFNSLSQGSSTFQIVRATLTISMMPAGHKATHDVHVHIVGKSGRSVSLTTNHYIMCRQRVGLRFVVIFSKRPAGHGKGLRGPRVEDPCLKW